MKIHFFSLNTLINIPSVRFIVQYFIDKYNTTVTITERAVKNENNYYDNNRNIIFDNIEENKNRLEYNSQSTIRKIKKYFSLIAKIKKSLKTKESSIIITPDFQVLFFIILLHKFLKKKNKKIIYLQFELFEYPGKINAFFNNYILKNADKIDLAIFPEINRSKLFVDNCKIPPKNTLILPNSCASVKDIKPERHSIFDNIPLNAFIVGHVGNLGDKNHYFNAFLEVAEKLATKNIYFIFLGKQSKEVQMKKKQIINSKILFFDKVPHQELVNIYPFFNLGVILYKGISPNYEYAAPNKLYEFWASGIPVVAHKLKGLKNVFVKKFLGTLTDMNHSERFYEDILKYYLNNNNSREIKSYFDENLEISLFLKELGKSIDSINMKNYV